jgi:hypothetical protein
MSGVSHFVPRPLPPSGHDWRKFGNPPPNNYFKSREVNFNDFDYGYDTNYDYDYGQYDCYPEYVEYEQYPDNHINNYSYAQPDTSEAFVEEIVPNPEPSENKNFQKIPESDKRK